MIRRIFAVCMAVCGSLGVMAEDTMYVESETTQKTEHQVEQKAEKEWKFSLGAGVFVAESPYMGVGNDTVLVPMVSARYGDFFAGPAVTRYSVVSLGYKMINTEKFSLSLLFNPVGGFAMDSDDMRDGYENINDRKMQMEAGLDMVYKPEFLEGLRLNLYGVWGERGGHWGGAIGKLWKLNEKWSVYGRVLATAFSHDYVDYYFEVSAEEAIRNNRIGSSYGADAEFSVGTDVTLTYRVNDKWSIHTFAGFEQLSNGIKDSPIVEDDALFRGGVSVLYHF